MAPLCSFERKARLLKALVKEIPTGLLLNLFEVSHIDPMKFCDRLSVEPRPEIAQGQDGFASLARQIFLLAHSFLKGLPPLKFVVTVAATAFSWKELDALM